MPICDISTRASKQLAPGVHAQTFWEQNLLLSRVELAPGSSVPAHSHVHEQAIIVLSGALRLLTEGATHHLAAGAMYLIPSNVEHEVQVDEEGCVLIDCFSPIRESLQY